jgi:hypothetical protein
VVAEPDTVDPLQREHFARRAVPVDLRNAKIGILARVLGHLGSRRGLKPKIHFDRNRTGKRGHDLDRAQPPPFRRKRFR